MASALLSRAIAGFQSVRSSVPLAKDSRIVYSSFLKVQICKIFRFVWILRNNLFTQRGAVAGARARTPTSVSSPAFRFVRCASTSPSAVSMASSAVQSVSRSEPVVSCDWLHSNLREPDVKVLDASWYMPDEQRNPLQEYQVAHIPGALFFDVDGISDRTSNVGPATFEAKLQPHLLWTLEQIRQNVDNQTYQHVDARSKARFDGVAPEPRKGIKGGHVPGSKCIPFSQMLDGSQMLLPSSEISKRFEQEGISLERPVVTSCGTGVTACILALGLHRIGKVDVPVYDGSWTEWGSHPDTPVSTA